MIRTIIISFTGLTLGLGFLACQSDVTDPTPFELLEEYDNNPALWEYPAIWGYAKDGEGNPIYMAKVTWVSEQNQELGFCISRMDGWYRITDLTGAWEVYNGEYLDGLATHSLYATTSNSITEYEYPNNYRRGFPMDPDPGHGTLTTNGQIKGRVKDDATGDYIYPACVTVYGQDEGFLGYDTTWVGDPTYGYRGRYFIHAVVGWGWEEYDGMDLDVMAEAPGYDSLTKTIPDYEYGETYIVDFDLVPEE